MCACITVRRQSPDDAGVREIYVSVDGEQIAVPKNGQDVTHELPAGPHRLRAHNTLFWKTHDVVLQPGEHARFKPQCRRLGSLRFSAWCSAQRR